MTETEKPQPPSSQGDTSPPTGSQPDDSQIRAFSPSPADGSTVAEATVNVQYGRAADE